MITDGFRETLAAFKKADAECDTANRVPQEVWDEMEAAIIENEARGPRWQAKYAFDAMCRVFLNTD